jgi:hypothetical protein
VVVVVVVVAVGVCVENEGGFEIKTDIPTGKRVEVRSHVMGIWPVLLKYIQYCALGLFHFLKRSLMLNDNI